MHVHKNHAHFYDHAHWSKIQLKYAAVLYDFNITSLVYRYSPTSIIQTLDYLNFGTKLKVQVKVQILGIISIFACPVECSAAIVCYVRVNDS